MNSTSVACAIETCRQRRAASVLSDPLGFAEYEAGSMDIRVATQMPVDADFFTRPKQGGETRVEVVPDFFTTVQLQLVAEQVPEREPTHDYEYWTDTARLWIRHALVDGMSVILADVEDYFPSIPASGIRRALDRLQLTGDSIETTLSAIHEINTVPDENGGTRTGLPISDEELLWLLADAVLCPVDDCLSVDPLVSRHTRWIDDFILAVDSPNVDRALVTLSDALAAEGFHLNERKTRVLDSLADYECQAMTNEHRLVTNLTMIGSKCALSKSQQSALARLVDRERSRSPEHVRLWKRIYSLARKLHYPALVPEALNDLDRFPTAERQITSYLHALNWPSGTATRAVEQMAKAPTDSQAIILLRALLDTPQALARSAVATLRDVLESEVDRMHPYAIILLQACLIKQQSKHDWMTIAKRMEFLAINSRSPLARRIAIELLWMIPEKREFLARAVSMDTSPTVWGLGNLPAIKGTKQGQATILAEKRTFDDSWGGLGSKVSRTWMGREA